MRTILIVGLVAFFATGAQACGRGFDPCDDGRFAGGGHGGGGHGGHGGGGHGGQTPNPVPEIDVLSGFGALATLGALGALVWERRRQTL
jgi:hypothetical protein